MSEKNFFSGASAVLLNRAGYQSVFDIIRQERAVFVQSLPDVQEIESQHIYHEARQRAENLRSLYRAWQLRQEPVIGGLKKLSTTSSQPLHETLKRNIAGDGDFSDLLSRSSDYADAASIQSLFSPGRYAAALYRVAKTLHKNNSALHIDQRRPDLKGLILSEAAMNQQVTALDILLEVLQRGEAGLVTLADTYYPMTLPYDDNLMQINAALSAQGRTLNGLGDTLSDAMGAAFATMASPRLFVAPRVIAGQHEGQTFYLKAKKSGQNAAVCLSSPSTAGTTNSAHLTLGQPLSVAVPLRFTWVPEHNRNTLYLGVSGETAVEGTTLTANFLKGDSCQNSGQTGRYALMDNLNGSGLSVGHHLLVTIEPHHDAGAIKLKTPQGYIGWEPEAPATDGANPLILDAPEGEALAFILCKDANGTPMEDTTEVFPLRADTQPSPPTRNTLKLTPNSFQLLVQADLTLENVTTHYGLNKLQNEAALATTLNNIGTYCQRTGLTFNQLLGLTAQRSFTCNADAPASRYKQFGASSHASVQSYGAVYLNGAINNKDTPHYLWVQSDGETLNFQDSTVVELAGRAGKLIRLKNQTGLSFEMLDWLIVNASRSASTADPVRGLKALLDRPVLDMLATYVSLQQRYGIDVNTFVSFIGDINPYAPSQEKSFFETCFTSLDGNRSISLNQHVSTTTGELTAICYQALGVTSDEFTRITAYCFGGPQDSITLTPGNAGRLYRFGAIPRMLGLTFAQAEQLWRLMAGGQDSLLRQLGAADTLNAPTLIARTEQVLAWMHDTGLNLVQLQGMVSEQHSATATAEMFTFLQTIMNSVHPRSNQPPSEDPALAQQLHRTLASGFNLKANVMARLLDWQTALRSGDDEDVFTVDAYWQSIQALFNGNASIDQLQQKTTLVTWTQQLSQLVVIAHWLSLTELDLQLLTKTPTQLHGDWSQPPSPSLAVLLLLSRFKTWQTQVTVSRDEALRLLEQLNEKGMCAEAAHGLIAAMHQQDETTTQQVMAHLFYAGWPQDFASLWQLLTWLRTGVALNVGAATLGDLQTMMHPTPEAEKCDLIKSVSRNLSAGISQR
ncbi:Tc toxin subunit A [Aeromonas sp. HMWF014]|uniref:Tc toxin subunit A n=1 Tax=Aeromonas sp. HMWF014 TaxID=2056850 RepID=UPI000D367A85|nr:Tc toxin subunit A [Aeromonas sp. HMWF014]PTT50539.1 insecticidal toxin complex protein TcaA [Aeromonas sp. HMWF014]